MEPWRRLDLAGADQARDLLGMCCGASAWIERMLGRRPFRSLEALLETAREAWFALDARDWREAFSHHPKIGDREALRLRFAKTRHLSEREQEAAGAAPDEVLTNLADLNRVYEEKFGYIFIVCATGRSAEDMLATLRARLDHEPVEEIRIAAAEQAKITELRLRAIT